MLNNFSRSVSRLRLHLNTSGDIVFSKAFNYVAFGNAFEALNQDTAFISFLHFFYVVFEAFQAANLAVPHFFAVALDAYFKAARNRAAFH